MLSARRVDIQCGWPFSLSSACCSRISSYLPRHSKQYCSYNLLHFFFFQAEDGIRDIGVTGVQTCALPISQQMVEKVLELPEKTRFMVLAPVVRGRKGEYGKLFADLAEQGYARVRVDGELHELPVELNLDKNYKHDVEVVVDRLVVREGIERRLTDSVETALGLAEGLVLVETVERDGSGNLGESMLFSENFMCTNCGASIAEIQPRTFSFNSPHGACSRCDGLGSRLEIDPVLVVPNEDLSVNEGAVVPWANSQTEYHGSVLQGLAEKYGIDLDTRWCDLPEEHNKLILYGTEDERIYVSYRN